MSGDGSWFAIGHQSEQTKYCTYQFNVWAPEKNNSNTLIALNDSHCTGAALSYDGTLFAIIRASGLSGSHVSIWSSHTGTAMTKILVEPFLPANTFGFSSCISFSRSNSIIQTGHDIVSLIGTPTLGNSTGAQPCYGYGVSQDGKCITKDKKAVIFLPEAFRPDFSRHEGRVQCASRTMAFMNTSGRLVLFAFSEYPIDSIS